jgi:hypothetical protein
VGDELLQMMGHSGFTTAGGANQHMAEGWTCHGRGGY